MPSQSPRNMDRKKMEGKVEKKLQIRMVEWNMNEINKNSIMLMSPTTSEPSMRKSSSVKVNCLCSPTKHVGSFRCRRHCSARIHHARSIDSNLSAMASKHSLQPQ